MHSVISFMRELFIEPGQDFVLQMSLIRIWELDGILHGELRSKCYWFRFYMTS